MQVVLASQSPARLSVLRAAGVDPVVRVSGVDEDAVAAALGEVGPDEVVQALATAKAEVVAPQFEDALVFGCDSMLWFGGVLAGKPATAAVALERWAEMAGKSGELLTGHAVLRVRGGEVVGVATGTQRTVIRFGSPSVAEVEAYVASGEPMQVAGAFTLDGRGGWFVDGIDGDPSSVVGISLPLVRRLAAEVGLSVVDLWAASGR